MMCLGPEHLALELHILALAIHLTLPITTALSNTWGYTQLIFLEREGNFFLTMLEIIMFT